MILKKLIPLALLCFLQLQGNVAQQVLGVGFGASTLSCSANEQLELLEFSQAIGVLAQVQNPEDDEMWMSETENGMEPMDVKRADLCDNLPEQATANGLGCPERRVLAEEALAVLQGEQGERRLDGPHCRECCYFIHWNCHGGCSCDGRRNLRLASRNLQTPANLDSDLTAAAKVLCASPSYKNKIAGCVDCDNASVHKWG